MVPGEPRRVTLATWRSRTAGCLRWVWQRPWLALPLLAIPALLPLCTRGLLRSPDGILHLLRLVLVDLHVQNGVLFPRWMPELVGGLGYPLLNFYSPLAYYMTEFLHLLGLDFVSALLAGFAVLVLAAGFGMYLFTVSVYGAQHRWAALVAATAYMYAPYLLTNAYVRGAIAEVAALAWLPWVFWSIRRLLTAKHPARSVLAVTLTLSGLALTHNITLLFAPVVLACYILLLWSRTGRSANRLAWMAVAIGAAIALSAFFLAPLVFERQYLGGPNYTVDTAWVGRHGWTWRNFVQPSFAFRLHRDEPFNLGLAQVVLALVGLFVARRRDAEWLFFIALALLGSFFASVWSAPLWVNSQILQIAQFPWRLLAYITLPLALFTGGIVLRLPRSSYQAIGALAVIALIVFTNRPQLVQTPVLARPGDRIALPYVTRFEDMSGALGLGWSHEFLPRWAQGSNYRPSTEDQPAVRAQITVSQASPYTISATVSTPSEQPLRFTSLYYPAWRVTLADGTVLPTYPSTNLGLLTVDAPAGTHELTVRWARTPWQQAATWLSLLTLAGLTVFVGLTYRRRWLALLPLALLAFGLAGVLARPAIADVYTPREPVGTPDLQLLGYHYELNDDYELNLYPYWYSRQTPPGDTLISWQLRDAAGNVVSEVKARPYFNSQDARNWPPGTLVDDAYSVPLPVPSYEPPVSYELAVQVTEDGKTTAWTPVGTVTIDTPPPAQTLIARFGGLIDLVGFDLRHNDRPVELSASHLPVVRPGDTLEYSLHWRALQAVLTDYHGFVHLLDSQSNTITKHDKLAGSASQTAPPWPPVTLETDRYTLRIPEDTPSGLYWPAAGLYEPEDVSLLPVRDARGTLLGDTYRLPPIKVLGAGDTAQPQQPLSARFGDLATLRGYDLALPVDGLHPGSAFTVTLYYQANTASEQDLTQFVQLFSPVLGMAAQQDRPPQQGVNPTWAWQADERISDTFTLTVDPAAKPGPYNLQMGLYDLKDGARLPVHDRSGQPVPNGQVILTRLDIQP